MTFQTGIPNTGQTLGFTRDPIRTNFSALRNTISNGSGSGGLPNHIDVNSTGAGKHIFVQMPVKTPGAGNLTLTGEFGLIAQTAAGKSELFFTRDGLNTAGTPIYYQLTTGTPTSTNPGQSFLPGGVIIQWGLVTMSAGLIMFTNIGMNAFPNNLFMVQLTSNVGSIFAATNGSLSKTGFQFAAGNANPISVNILAIGN